MEEIKDIEFVNEIISVMADKMLELAIEFGLPKEYWQKDLIIKNCEIEASRNLAKKYPTP